MGYSCFFPDGPCYKVLIDFTPVVAALLAFLAAMFAAAIAVRNVSRQLEQSRTSINQQLEHARTQQTTELANSFAALRYEAVRHKRAVAKALLEELNFIVPRRLNGGPDCGLVPPTVYISVVGEIGRLNTESIAHVVRFYALYMAVGNVASEAMDKHCSELKREGKLAVCSLIRFLEITEGERDWSGTTLAAALLEQGDELTEFLTNLRMAA